MKIHLLLLTALLALALLPGCDTGTGPSGDPGTEPEPTITNGLTGTLTFTGQWPANPVELRMITSKVFPPVMSEIAFDLLLLRAPVCS